MELCSTIRLIGMGFAAKSGEFATDKLRNSSIPLDIDYDPLIEGIGILTGIRYENFVIRS